MLSGTCRQLVRRCRVGFDTLPDLLSCANNLQLGSAQFSVTRASFEHRKLAQLALPETFLERWSCRQLHVSCAAEARIARRKSGSRVAESAGAAKSEGDDDHSLSSGNPPALQPTAPDNGEDALKQGPSGSPGAAPSRQKPSRVSPFEPDFLIERYMRLRAGGKRLSEEDEVLFRDHLLSRAQQLQPVDETLAGISDPADSDEDDEVDEDNDGDGQEEIDVNPPPGIQSTERAELADVKEVFTQAELDVLAASAARAAVEDLADQDVHGRTSGDVNDGPSASPAGGGAAVQPEQTSKSGGTCLSAHGLAWRPKQRELTQEELRRDLILRRLAHEVNERLDTPSRGQVLADSIPTYLLSADKGVMGLPVKDPPVEVGTRLLRLGVVGVPNAGKSALTNHLVGGKVSAVSSRPETTRSATLGAFTEGTTQVVLYDTPGMHGSRDFRSRSHAMRVAATWTNVAECDALAYIVDGHKQLGPYATRHVLEIAESLGSQAGPGVPEWRRPPVLLLMNKVDLVGRQRMRLLAQHAEELGRVCEFERVFFISAQKGDGMADLRRYLISLAKPGEWELPPHAPTDQDWPELAAELVREKLYWNHKNEIPYKLLPVTVEFREHADGRVQIDQEVAVRSQRVKQMVSGPNNERVMRIERTVGAEMAHMLKRRVELSLKVKVRKDAALPAHML